jgi:hypothetical protein
VPFVSGCSIWRGRSKRHSRTAEVLGLDRVWITADSRAKLLDFPAPGQPELDRESAGPPQTSVELGIFLKRTAISALQGRALTREEAAGDVACRLPLSARDSLGKLDALATPDQHVAALEPLTHSQPAVTPQRRAAVFAACWLLPAVMALYLLVLAISERQFLHEHPEVGELAGYVGFYELLPREGGDADSAKLREAVEVSIAHRFRDTIQDDRVWAEPAVVGFLSADDRHLLREIVLRHPNPSPEAVADAQRRLESVAYSIWYLGWSTEDYLYSGPLAVILIGTLAMLFGTFVVLPSLTWTLLAGEPPLLRMLEIAVVDREGAPASRLRVIWRSVVLWTIVSSGFGVLILVATWGRPRFAVVLVLYWLVLLFTAERGLHDKIAGTWLVPR